MNEVWFALGITLFAGMATGIGSAIAFTAKRTNYRFLSVATGFSAGVMLYVSFVEILLKGAQSLTQHYGEYWGHWINTGSFFGGMLVIGMIDCLIPAARNPHETRSETETMPLHTPVPVLPYGSKTNTPDESATSDPSNDEQHRKKLVRMSMFTALAIGIHNFPEGLATFLAALQEPGLGVAIGIAIALHNIPEGISVSVPIFYATSNRGRAFLYSVLSGLAEPLGAGIAYLILLLAAGGGERAVPTQVMGMIFSGVAGIMVYISLDELLPTSRAFGKGHDSLLGLISGMLVMALSLLLMK